MEANHGVPKVLSADERRELASNQIEAARLAVSNGEEVNIDALDPRVHGSETVSYVQMLRRRGVAALHNHNLTL